MQYAYRMLKWFRKKKPDLPKLPVPEKPMTVDERSPDVYGVTKIPRYPPFMEGIPGQQVSVGRLLQDQTKLMKRIRHSVGGSTELWAHYHDAIHAYTTYVHLLPASERHHHRGAGGLLRHGLECSAYALELARDIIIAPHETPRQRKIIEPRWMLGLFVAALCHDIGKPATDVEVVDEQGNAWNPMDMSLTEWTQTQHVDRYFLRWRSQRYKLHEALTGLLVDRVLSNATRSWMAIAGPHVLIETLGALTGISDTLGEMARLVKEADQSSTQQDLSDQPFTSLPETGVPVDSFVIDAMRGLYREHPQWEVNKPGCRLWFMDDSLFIIWPKGGQEVTQHLQKAGTRGIPSAPDSLADILIERSVAVAPAANGRYWVLVPDLLQKDKARPVSLVALRLSESKLLIKHDPPAETGQVIAESEWRSVMETTSPDAAHSSTSESNQNRDVISTSPTPKSNQNSHAKSDKKAITPKSARDWLSQYGLAGTVLEHFAEDVISGYKQWERDLTWLGKGKQLAIRYPSAINGYGVEPPVWLGQCFDLDWLAQDRHNPMKRLFDTPIGGENYRCVLLEGEVCGMLSVLFDAPSAKDQPVQAPVPERQAPTPEQAPAKKPHPINAHEPPKKPTNKPALSPNAKPDNPWPGFLAALKSQQNNAPKLEKREGKSVVDAAESVQWYADTIGQTRSKLRIALSKQTQSTRFIKIDNRGYIHVE